MNQAIAARARDIRSRVLFAECAADPNPARREARLYSLAKLADDYAARFARRFTQFDRAQFMTACGFDIH